MNGKLARALRHGKAKKATVLDAERLQRFAWRLARQIANRPIEKPERERKIKPARVPSWPRTDDQKLQSRPAVMVHPLHKFKQRLENVSNTVKNLTGGYAKSMRDMNSMPKHILDRMSASLGEA